MPPKVDVFAVTTSGKQAQSINKGEVKCRNSYYDKQSGSYGRVTTKESVSSGDYTNRGRTGYKDEYKADTTVRVSDKRGYTEYSRQERFTMVDYDGGNSNYSGNKVGWGGGGGYAVDNGYSSSDEGGGVNTDDDRIDNDGVDDASADVDDYDDDCACSSGGSDGYDDYDNDDDDGYSDDDYYSSDD